MQCARFAAIVVLRLAPHRSSLPDSASEGLNAVKVAVHRNELPSWTTEAGATRGGRDPLPKTTARPGAKPPGLKEADLQGHERPKGTISGILCRLTQGGNLSCCALAAVRR
jgi:hypothetical protein